MKKGIMIIALLCSAAGFANEQKNIPTICLDGTFAGGSECSTMDTGEALSGLEDGEPDFFEGSAALEKNESQG